MLRVLPCGFDGTGKMGTLATWCATDGVLGIVAPIALAAAAGTALVVDLDQNGPRYPGAGSLAHLVESGPRLSDLRPTNRGVAVLRNGGIGEDDATEVLDALIAGWSNVVLRGLSERCPVVPVIPLLPGGMTEPTSRAAVYQQLGWHEKAPGPAVTLPTPSRSVVGALLEGRMPLRSRWIKAWRPVWDLPWA
jgi:hypothetical protein